jgi:hypothetical protein
MKHFKISKLFETKNKTIFQILVYNEKIFAIFSSYFYNTNLVRKNQQIMNLELECQFHIFDSLQYFFV